MAADPKSSADRAIDELEKRVAEMRKLAAGGGVNLSDEITSLEQKLGQRKRERSKNMTAWQRVQIARHPKRPFTLDLIGLMGTDFVELRGDRAFADDPAVVGGFVTFGDHPVVVIGHQKGHDTKENLARNFGMPNPEGIRKGLRLMKLAEKFSLPVVTFLDTAGAFPGLATEERGGAEAIGHTIRDMAALTVPVVACVIGEGGSGGALAFGVGDRILMFENAYYSVISPEGCAAILYRDGGRAADVAEALKLTAKDLLALGIVDEIVPEPPGGAHLAPLAAAVTLQGAIVRALDELRGQRGASVVAARYRKFRAMGVLAGTA